MRSPIYRNFYRKMFESYQRAPTDLLHEICKANLSLWILLASSPDNIPMDSSLVSMLREKSPTDELFWMGSATPQDKDEIYPQTRYILCHLLSEIFIRLGTLIEDDLAKLLSLEEGYKRLVGVEILFLMKRKNCEVKACFQCFNSKRSLIG